MNEPTNNVPAEVIELVSELTDGSLSATGRDRLRQLLAENPDALDWYSQWMDLHSLLYLDLQHPSESVITPQLTPTLTLVDKPDARKGRPRWKRTLAAAVFTAIAASLLITMYTPDAAPQRDVAAIRHQQLHEPAPEKIEEFQRDRKDAVAVLSQAADAAWPDGIPLDVGSPVPSGRFEIESGLVQLDFLSGANLVVEGPAELDLLSNMLVVCRRGKVRAHIPPQAHGFTIDTPRHRTVDLGTEFAINVNDDQLTEVHVLDGEVELYDLDAKNEAVNRRNLLLGHGVRALPDGEVSDIDADAEKFIGAEEMLSRSMAQSASRYAKWRELSDRTRQNPDVVAYYSFEDHQPWQRMVQNDGPLTDPGLTGALVGCRWAEGRWPGKDALEFKSTEDRIRLNIPGEYKSITLACWVRVDGFDRWLSSLLLTDGHNLGEVHWQFTETGQLLLGVKAELNESQEYLTDTVLRPVDLGRWVHLACVYDAPNEEVVHYVDGRRVSTIPIILHTPLRFGAAEIGNWVPEDLSDHRIRSLNGRMDEFVLLKTTSSDEEIRAMYEAGRPH
jgi:hypothetical protein